MLQVQHQMAGAAYYDHHRHSGPVGLSPTHTQFHHPYRLSISSASTPTNSSLLGSRSGPPSLAKNGSSHQLHNGAHSSPPSYTYPLEDIHKQRSGVHDTTTGTQSLPARLTESAGQHKVHSSDHVAQSPLPSSLPEPIMTVPRSRTQSTEQSGVPKPKPRTRLRSASNAEGSPPRAKPRRNLSGASGTSTSEPQPLPRHIQSTTSSTGGQLGSERARTSGDLPSASRASKLVALSGEHSLATLENARYSLDGYPTSDHPNEDRNFVIDGTEFKAFAVFDGHDGPRAAGFASNYMRELFEMPSWSKVIRSGGIDIPLVLNEFFKTTESDFFKSIRQFITERNRLQASIPSHLKSYEAYQLYPTQVNRIQELEPRISGGCTAVVAVIANNTLYVANVGDSRAVLIREASNGTLYGEQLTVDHSVESEEELRRLEMLGLDPKQLIKAGRLGTQENTRSIGDYYIKEGYRNVDSLVSASGPPGLAIPYMMEPKPLDETFRYLVLMSDGVYKSIEGVFEHKESIESNKVLVNMIDHTVQNSKTFLTVSDAVLDRLRAIHEKCYQENARIDQRSPRATACRKRDDMTLMIYKFGFESSL